MVGKAHCHREEEEEEEELEEEEEEAEEEEERGEMRGLGEEMLIATSDGGDVSS